MAGWAYVGHAHCKRGICRHPRGHCARRDSSDAARPMPHPTQCPYSVHSGEQHLHAVITPCGLRHTKGGFCETMPAKMNTPTSTYAALTRHMLVHGAICCAAYHMPPALKPVPCPKNAPPPPPSSPTPSRWPVAASACLSSPQGLLTEEQMGIPPHFRIPHSQGADKVFNSWRLTKLLPEGCCMGCMLYGAV